MNQLANSFAQPGGTEVGVMLFIVTSIYGLVNHVELSAHYASSIRQGLKATYQLCRYGNVDVDANGEPTDEAVSLDNSERLKHDMTESTAFSERQPLLAGDMV